MRVQQFVHKESHPGYEMTTNPAVYRGDYLGVEERAGRKTVGQQMVPGVAFHHYQFTGLLLGEASRILHLYVPDPPDNRYAGILEESKAPVDVKSKGAALFVVGDKRQV